MKNKTKRLEPSEHELLLFSEHDNLIAKNFFTPRLMTSDDKKRLLELEVLIPIIYEKLGFK